MEIKLLSCPLCLKPHFEGVDSLRSSLITAATSPISCPVCNELLMGLDKLTIHLFSHIATSLQENMVKTNDRKDLPMQLNSPGQAVILNQQINDAHHDVKAVDVDRLPTVNPVLNENAEKRSIRCDICNFSFSDENILEMHQKLLHQTQADQQTGKYNYHCHLCSKKFKMRGSLMVHLRVAHFGFVNHENCDKGCDVAKDIGGVKHAQKDGLPGSPEKIEKTLENKQWACDVCSKLFTTKYFLKKHKRLHTGEMPYFCAQCNKSFTFQQSYHKHMLYHSSEKPHVCNECGRAFKELSTLHNHERIHSGERPFACETCGKCFRQRVSYLVHRRIHTGVMPYKCTACDKCFRYKVSQKSHKCSANPPGSVIRAPILVDKIIQKANNRLLPTKVIDTGTDTADPGMALSLNLTPGENVNSIIFNSEGQIIGQNFTYDGQNIIRFTPNVEERKSNDEKMINNQAKAINANVPEPTSSIDNQTMSSFVDGENADFFSMVMSPGMPDVQTLYLSSPENDHSQKKTTLDTINEESFKKLLYGQVE